MILSMTGAATVLLVFRVEEEEGGGSVAGYVTVTLICFFVFNFAYGWGYVLIPLIHTPLGQKKVPILVKCPCFWG